MNWSTLLLLFFRGGGVPVVVDVTPCPVAIGYVDAMPVAYGAVPTLGADGSIRALMARGDVLPMPDVRGKACPC